MKHVMKKIIATLFLITLSFNTIADAFSDALSDRDYETAFKLALEGAEAGVAQSQHYACAFYLKGTGTTKDVKKAFYWCQKAALQGYVASEHALGDIYKHE